MEEIVLNWPNVSLFYMDRTGSWGCLREFREIEKGQYGYRLTVGQQLQTIRYRGTNYDIFVRPTVVEIRPDGLVVTHLLRDEDPRKPWERDDDKRRRGIFWQHGGWRTTGDRISQENLHNFVKLGQQELF